MMARNGWWPLVLTIAMIGCDSKPEDANQMPGDPGHPPTKGEAGKAGPSSNGSPYGMTGPGGGGPSYPADYPRGGGKEKGEAKPDEKKDETKPSEKKDETPKADAAATLSTDELAEIKKLPEAQQALAIKQLACPISGEHLGSMGKPLVKTVDGKDVFLCCKGCLEDFDKDPKAALAKLPKN